MNYFARRVRPYALTVSFGIIVATSLISPTQGAGMTGTEERARQLCQTVIGVQPGQNHFDGCVSSLSNSLENVRHDRAVVQARNSCFAQGLKTGSAELSLCLPAAADTKLQSVSEEQPGSISLVASVTDDPQPTASYSTISFDIALRRERLACAMLGFDPAFAAFANCVANLQTTLHAADIPEG